MCRLAGVLPSGSPWSARRALAEHGLALRAPVVGNAEADLPRGVHVDLEVAVTHHLDVHQQPARLDDHGAHTLGTSKEFVQAAARALDTGAECLQDRGALALVQVEVVVLLRVVPLLVVVPIVRHHSRLLLGRALITRPPAQRLQHLEFARERLQSPWGLCLPYQRQTRYAATRGGGQTHPGEGARWFTVCSDSP